MSAPVLAPSADSRCTTCGSAVDADGLCECELFEQELAVLQARSVHTCLNCLEVELEPDDLVLCEGCNELVE
jgi:hypothetical protein